MSVERQRTKTVAIFVVANLIQDAFVLVSNLCTAVQGFCASVINTFSFVKYDQARKYRDLTGGDFGAAIGCPGHFTGDCAHIEDGAEVDDE